MRDLFRQAGIIVIPVLVYVIMRLLWVTCRKRFHNLSEIDESQHVCVCWHGELLMSPQAYRKIHPEHKASAIISSHFDGSLIAGTLRFLKIRPLRGSTKKGARQVLLQAFKSIKAGEEVLITPDGPRGPRHSMSDGAIGIALKSRLPIFVMNYQPSSYWQLGSWDRFVIPKPFCRIDFYIQSLSLEGMEIEEAKEYLKEKMLEHTVI
ncbi:lysophospholipid acyltransferase family protein [Sulfurovum sp. ST-21]|uniref:Lysophospholipid acyltransferase family protein n=1 Tax=Sulfurovum indicum TaxID=2779528 RepID=A0A7M1S3Z3_9BACT|nr:lysophospholipid acyltransferase family protein [Sulfurovum indicum]QOR62143.1 lysophospholipid acyltransferase family protein [Sulfurovum indicum]